MLANNMKLLKPLTNAVDWVIVELMSWVLCRRRARHVPPIDPKS